VRISLARFAGVAAGLSLVVAPLAVAGPAHAVDPGDGTITVTIVDDLGKPVVGSAALFHPGDTPLTLGMTDGEDGSSPVAAATFTESVPAATYGVAVMGGWGGYTCVVPAGSYALMVMGGWPLISCFGVDPCLGLGGLGGLGGSTPTAPTYTAVLTVADGGTASYEAVTKTPKVTGTPRVGQTLAVTSPLDLGMDLGDLVGDFIGPKVVWMRNGAKIAGAKGAEYTLTGRDAGNKVSAKISFPPLLALLFSSVSSGMDITPAPITTKPQTIGKNASKTTLKVSGGTAFVRVSGQADEVSGWVQLTMKGANPIWGRVQEGFAPINLPTMKPGKYSLTAVYQGNNELNGSKATTKVTVKKSNKSKRR
jgi:hypothetical protein